MTGFWTRGRSSEMNIIRGIHTICYLMKRMARNRRQAGVSLHGPAGGRRKNDLIRSPGSEERAGNDFPGADRNWQAEMKKKIDQAKEIIQEQELNSRILYLRDRRHRRVREGPPLLEG